MRTPGNAGNFFFSGHFAWGFLLFHQIQIAHTAPSKKKSTHFEKLVA